MTFVTFIIAVLTFSGLPAYANSGGVLPAIFSLLFDEPEAPIDNGTILLNSGEFVGTAVVFNNADNDGLDITIQTSNNIARVLGLDDSLDDQLLPDPMSNVSISPVAEGVYISGFSGSSTITLTFSREVSLQSIAINIQSESPMIGFSVTIPSISSFNSNGELSSHRKRFLRKQPFFPSCCSSRSAYPINIYDKRKC